VAEDLENYCLSERRASLGEDSFFVNKAGRRMHGQSFLNRLRKIKARAGIEKSLCLHGLRHSIATHLLENGLPVEYVRDFLGHQFLETTKIYTRVSPLQLKNIHEKDSNLPETALPP
jgi:integrase/recombinase XerD